ncbi:MAG: DUF4037 domain-containing protein, partial [Oscillibacter sp.]|nr:DUF4037 domain-containing protein [Oscillibacter sp.]
MKGLELCRGFYEEYGAPMLREQFADVLPLLAVGVCGAGSECLGYDDTVSTDHDFEPGFCIFLPDEKTLDRQTAFRLERAYAKLPREYGGFSRPRMEAVGGARRGVLRTADFFREKCGAEDALLTLEEWLRTPEHALLEAVNGEIWSDPYGEVTRLRERLSYLPEDVRRKKLAGQLLLMAQSGQYNYRRCILHGERAAAQLAVFEFVRSALSAAFLLNRRYQPYYKWAFRALRDLPLLSELAAPLEALMTTENDGEIAEDKYYTIEDI